MRLLIHWITRNTNPHSFLRRLFFFFFLLATTTQYCGVRYSSGLRKCICCQSAKKCKSALSIASNRRVHFQLRDCGWPEAVNRKRSFSLTLPMQEIQNDKIKSSRKDMLTHLVQRSPRRHRLLRCHRLQKFQFASLSKRVEEIAFSIVYIDIWTAKSITWALFEEMRVRKAERASEWEKERKWRTVSAECINSLWTSVLDWFSNNGL